MLEKLNNLTALTISRNYRTADWRCQVGAFEEKVRLRAGQGRRKKLKI
jgi:hypothetical protein